MRDSLSGLPSAHTRISKFVLPCWGAARRALLLRPPTALSHLSLPVSPGTSCPHTANPWHGFSAVRLVPLRRQERQVTASPGVL